MMSFADMRAHMDSKHPRETMDEAGMKEAFDAARAATNAKVRSAAGQMNKKAFEVGNNSGSGARAAGDSDNLAMLLAEGLAGAAQGKKK